MNAANNESDKLSMEQYFLRYAFPCAFVLLQQKKISQEEYEQLKKRFDNNEIVPREELERYFSSAFRRINKIAGSNDCWDTNIIKKYFRSQEHNMFIDADDGDYKYFPESLKELCRVHVAEIIAKEKDKATGDVILSVRYGNKERKVLGKLVSDAKIGDKVTIHFAFAVEKVE